MQCNFSLIYSETRLRDIYIYIYSIYIYIYTIYIWGSVEKLSFLTNEVMTLSHKIYMLFHLTFHRIFKPSRNIQINHILRTFQAHLHECTYIYMRMYCLIYLILFNIYIYIYYIYIYIYIYTYIYISIYIYIYEDVLKNIHMYIYRLIQLYIHIYMFIYTFGITYINNNITYNSYIYIYICVCVCVCVCV